MPYLPVDPCCVDSAQVDVEVHGHGCSDGRLVLCHGDGANGGGGAAHNRGVEGDLGKEAGGSEGGVKRNPGAQAHALDDVTISGELAAAEWLA